MKSIEFLKSQTLSGPFTKQIEFKFFMKSNITLQEKQRCMRKEVKHAMLVCHVLQ